MRNNKIDKRGSLLSTNDIQRWYDTRANGYKIGLRSPGEFKMDCDFGSVLIMKPDNSEWINFGNYHFSLGNINSWKTPDQWKDPFRLSEDGEYLVLNWIFYHVHGAIKPVVIHIPSRTFTLVEPRRILFPKQISTASGQPILTCTELIWSRSGDSENREQEFSIPLPMQPIEEFFQLDPFCIDTIVAEWRNGQYFSTPLRDYQRQKNG